MQLCTSFNRRSRFSTLFILAVISVIFYLNFLLGYRPLGIINSSSMIGNFHQIFNSDHPLPNDDPELLKYILNEHIYPPAPKDAPYKLKSLVAAPDVSIQKFLKKKTNGFFVECGAVDGEYISNTLGLEVQSGWTGLLVEGSPTLFQKLRSKNRKAFAANICLTANRPERIEFLKHKANYPEWRVGNGKINPDNKYEKPAKFGDEVFKREDYLSEGMVDCFPLYSVLLALNVTTVDFFSLDVEGHEYKILSAIPYDKVNIEVIAVEHWLTPEGSEAIKALLIKNNYKLALENNKDFIFVKS